MELEICEGLELREDSEKPEWLEDEDAAPAFAIVVNGLVVVCDEGW